MLFSKKHKTTQLIQYCNENPGTINLLFNVQQMFLTFYLLRDLKGTLGISTSIK